MRTVSDVDAMLAEAAERYGLSLEEFRARGRRGELVEPELRDLWLIWGDSGRGCA